MLCPGRFILVESVGRNVSFNESHVLYSDFFITDIDQPKEVKNLMDVEHLRDIEHLRDVEHVKDVEFVDCRAS